MGSPCKAPKPPSPGPKPPKPPKPPSPKPPKPPEVDTREYCCPDAKKCLTASSVSCAKNATVCSKEKEYPVCCPLTKLCVKPGADCTPPDACLDTVFCCPEAKKC